MPVPRDRLYANATVRRRQNRRRSRRENREQSRRKNREQSADWAAARAEGMWSPPRGPIKQRRHTGGVSRCCQRAAQEAPPWRPRRSGHEW
jgi:hypothetical protein